MPFNRFYIDSSLTCGEHVNLSGEEFNHLVRVMRGATGDTVELINGRHTLAFAAIEKIDKRSALLFITSIQELPPLLPPLILSIAMPRFNHLEWITEKATELGVNALWLFPGERSEKTNITHSQELRLRQLMIAGIKQSGRLDLPSLTIHPPMMNWQHPPPGTLFFGSTNPSAPKLAARLSPPPCVQPIIFFTGPEKGFSPEEELLLGHTWEAEGVSLHPLTLRAETAPIIAAGLLRHLTFEESPRFMRGVLQ